MTRLKAVGKSANGKAMRLLKIAIVPGDLPREQNIFHARAGADVVHNQVTLRGFVPDIDDHAYVFGASQPQVPRNDVSGQECFAATRSR